MRSMTLSLARWGVSAILLAALIGLALPTASQTVQAQGGNLLQNPGFEEPYVTLNGEDTLRLASSWQPWYLEGDGPSSNNARPEYKPAPANRVKAGSAAQEFNTFFASHTAGVFQRVPVTPGTELRFSAFIYVWSSASFANPDVSEDPNGVVVSVGIDTRGGTDPASPNVAWYSGAEFYDEYREVSVSATSDATAVTVFVRSETDPQGFVGANNVYVDEALLLPLGTVPTNTPAPTVTPDVGGPPTQEGTITSVPMTNTPIPTFTPNVPTTPTPDLPDDFNDSVLYTVVAGDTVWDLSRQFDSSVDAIIETNGLNDNGFLKIGQTLVIPIRGAAPPSAPATFTPVPTQAAGTGGPLPTTPTSYTVQPGDTLLGIASEFNTTVNTLAQMNNIVNPNLIFPGQVLTVSGPQPTPQPVPQTTPVPYIPTITPTPEAAQPQQPAPAPLPRPGTHVVQPGENLFRIGLRYNVTFDVLARANGLWNPNLIFPGQVLVIP